MRLYIKHKFDAAHFLPEYEGKCKNLHGHTWTVEIWIKKYLSPEDSMVVDFTYIKQVIDEFDHKCLNDFIYNPTAENLVRHFLREFRLFSTTVKVWESENSCIEGNTDEDM